MISFPTSILEKLNRINVFLQKYSIITPMQVFGNMASFFHPVPSFDYRDLCMHFEMSLQALKKT